MSTMSHSARHHQILDLLQTAGECSIDDLAKKFDVSGMTVRRDLQIMEKQGRIIRTHGGALLAPGVSFEFAFLRRAKHNQPQKRTIAQLAAGLIEDGQSVLFDSGTTTLAIAEQLRQRQGVKVITTSLPIASLLQYNESMEINLLGGQLRAGSPDLSGALTEANLEVICPDLAFIGADAIDDKGFVYTGTSALSGTLSRMIACAKTCYIVADSSKLGRRSLWKVGSLKELSGLITDEKAPTPFVTALTKAGIKVMRPTK